MEKKKGNLLPYEVVFLVTMPPVGLLLVLARLGIIWLDKKLTGSPSTANSQQ